MSNQLTSNTSLDNIPMLDLEITLDPSRIDVAAAHAFLTTSYWSPGIPLDIVERAVANSVCVAARSAGGQVGFARLVTDRATFAYLADVHVIPEYRGRGIAHRMLESLFGHPDVQGLRRLMLVTRDAHTLYRGFGFVAPNAPERIMERVTPNAYGVSLTSGSAESTRSMS